MLRGRKSPWFRRNYILLFLIFQVLEIYIILNVNIGKMTLEGISLRSELRNHNWVQFGGRTVGNRQKSNSSGFPVSLQLEKARRKFETTSNEFWYYLKHQLNAIQGDASLSDDVKQNILKILNASRDYQSTLKSDLNRLKTVDRLEEWRLRESLKLGRLVQNRLRYLQNPPGCSIARKLVCSTSICGPGFGCLINHYAMCLIVAYATQRTLIIPQGIPNQLEPLSETCTTYSMENPKAWRKGVENAQTVFINIDNIWYKPEFWPLAVPDDLADRLERFHGDPAAWWIGQIIAYIFRPTKDTKSNFDLKMFSREHIAGLHIRRTDKSGEAKPHSIENYMGYVEEWFDARAIQKPTLQRKIFIATDTPSVLDEIQDKYPQYEVIGNRSIANDAKPQNRGTDLSVLGIIHDIYYLSKCNYLVCTFSSNVCRMAYALMQTSNGDASRNIQSLDDVFYMTGQNDHHVRIVEAVSEHLGVGRKLVLLGNHWDGTSKVIGLHGPEMVPSYKLINEMVRAKMPLYPDVDENTFPPYSLWEDTGTLGMNED